MAVDQNFAGAFIDGSDGSGHYPVKVLGVRLRRLCLWHKLLLRTLNSPYLRQGAASMWELRTAVGICRLRFGDSRIRRPILVPSLIYVVSIVKLFLSSKKKRAAGYNPLRASLQKQSDAFLLYTGNYLQEPEYTVIPPKTRGTDGSRGRAPDELEQAAQLINWSKWTERTVWELPLGRANWYRVMAQRDAGLDVDFANEHDRQFRADMKAFDLKKNEQPG